MNNNIQTSSILPEDTFSSRKIDLESSKKLSTEEAALKTSVHVVENKLDREDKIEGTDKKEVEYNQDEFDEALETVSTFIESAMKNVSFSNDSTSGKTIIKVIDKETSEIISQFPSDKIVTMAEKIKDLQQEITSVSGILFDDNV